MYLRLVFTSFTSVLTFLLPNNLSISETLALKGAQAHLIPTYLLTIDKQPGRTIPYNRAGSSFSSSETCLSTYLPRYLAGIVLVTSQSRGGHYGRMSLFSFASFLRRIGSSAMHSHLSF